MVEWAAVNRTDIGSSPILAAKENVMAIHYMYNYLGTHKLACGTTIQPSITSFTQVTVDKNEVTCSNCLRSREYRGLPSRQRMWQKEMVQQVHSLSNVELLLGILQLAGGDDYDGAFTPEGYWEFRCLKEELVERLVEVGWLHPAEDVQPVYDNLVNFPY